MGVRFLKTIIEKHCKNAYTTLSLFSLSNQTLIIDTNIFMYKFKSTYALEQQFNNMLNKFILYNITPIFVFDGIPESNKQFTIDNRKQKREKSELIANSIKDKILNTTHKNKLKTLKKKLKYHENQSTKLYSYEFNNIKNLIQSYGFDIIQAKHEADCICAKHNINNNSFAVITEDTDLLVYGSKFVIYNIDFDKDIFTIVHTNSLIKSLYIKSLYDFQQICILSGTDYNKAYDIYISLCLYYFYIQTELKNKSFLTWCYTNNIISNKQYYLFTNIHDKYMFNESYISQITEQPQQLQL